MNATVQGIKEQFRYWRQAEHPQVQLERDQVQVVVGCGTSLYIAQMIASALNDAGYQALAVPGSEWTLRPRDHLGSGTPHVIAVSRSGESTEIVQAAARSRRDGLFVTAITCQEDSALAHNADRVLACTTHPAEGIVMTASASLMLLTGLRLAGVTVGESDIQAAEALLQESRETLEAAILGRDHFVFLAGGLLHGLAQEGALKLQEMSLSYTQAYYPMEYRHGPMSLVDHKTLIVMLYHPDTATQEQMVASDMQALGAQILGIGGPGDVELKVDGPASRRALLALPCLQLLGELVAVSKGLDSLAPRHLNKVVTLA